VFERAKTVHVLDSEATVLGFVWIQEFEIFYMSRILKELLYCDDVKYFGIMTRLGRLFQLMCRVLKPTESN
jgi:hypothetical protein